MRTFLLVLSLATPVTAQADSRLRADYEMYAHGLHIADFDASYGIGEGGYSLSLAFHTTGMAGLMFGGHQLNTSVGVWDQSGVAPLHVMGDGYWRGAPRKLAIDYDQGRPVIRELTPIPGEDRDPVPPEQQAHTMDTMSALVLLLRRVSQTGRCEAEVTTFDGRRLIRTIAHTAGMETLEKTSRSSFAGPALRCDFEGELLAGFLHGKDEAEARRPKKGSAWLAAPAEGEPIMPVRLSFETTWFGTATMYMTRAYMTQAQPAGTPADVAAAGQGARQTP